MWRESRVRIACGLVSSNIFGAIAMKETLDMQGQLTIQLTDRTGQVVQKQTSKNRIVTSGRTLVSEMFTGQFSGPPPTPVSHIGVGSGGTAPADADVALETQRGNRNVITDVNQTTFVDPNTGVMRLRVTLQTVFDFGEANDPSVPLREAGIFTADTGGVMYNRVVFPDVTKTDAFRLTLFWEIIF
jgi:hypothetical protein